MQHSISSSNANSTMNHINGHHNGIVKNNCYEDAKTFLANAKHDEIVPKQPRANIQPISKPGKT